MQHNTKERLPFGWEISDSESGFLFTFRGSPRAVAEAKARVQSLAGSMVEGNPSEGFAYAIVAEDRRAEALAELREDYADDDERKAPRNVRPSWIEIRKDDSSNNPAPCSVGKGGTGPRARSGSLSAVFKVRESGEVREALSVDVVGSRDGSTVTVSVWGPNGETLFFHRFAQ